MSIEHSVAEDNQQDSKIKLCVPFFHVLVSPSDHAEDRIIESNVMDKWCCLEIVTSMKASSSIFDAIM